MNNPSFPVAPGVAPDAATAWHSDFIDPPAEFRPVPFWSWNERMEPAEVRRQVALMKQGGWGGAFIHSRIGLLTPYLGEEWFAACDAVMKACREQGMLVWLYDEDKWPSGYSGGSVPLADAEFRFKTLIARPVGAPTPESCAPIGAPINDLQAYVWTSPLGDPWFNGTCYADLMNREAMRKFLDDAYEPYFDRYGELYGDLIRAEFTDEPTTAQRSRLPVGSVPFTGELPAKFKQMFGYDPLPKLVVIAIIAILAAILFPVFARARENARRSSCQSNLKQIGLGVLQYVQDYDESYPFGHNQGAGGVAGGFLQNWYIATDPYLKSRQIFSCPSDSSTVAAGNTGGYVPGGFHVSYAANIYVSGQNTSLKQAAIASTSTLAYIVDGGSAPNGAKNTVLETSTEKPFTGLRMLALASTSGFSAVVTSPTDGNFMGPTIRHLGTVNVAYADGHVKAVKAESFYFNNSWQMNPACDSPTNTAANGGCYDFANAP